MLLVMVLMVSTFIVPASAEGSNDRIQTFLELAAGKRVTNEDISGLTNEQLLFLGIYLSNFYQPFGTEFGDSNDEIAAGCREDMIEALQTQLAFSDVMANALVDEIIEMTRETITYLNVYYRENGEYVELDGSESLAVSPNYYNYFRMMIGESDRVFSFIPTWLGVIKQMEDNWVGRLDHGIDNMPVDFIDEVFAEADRRDDYGITDAAIHIDEGQLFKRIVSLSEKECGNGRLYLGDWWFDSEYYFPDGSDDDAWYNHASVLWTTLKQMYRDGGDEWDDNESADYVGSSSNRRLFGTENPEHLLSQSEFEEWLIKLYLYLVTEGKATIHNPLWDDDLADYDDDEYVTFRNGGSYNNSFCVYWIADTENGFSGNNEYRSDEEFAISSVLGEYNVSLVYQDPPGAYDDVGDDRETSIIGTSVIEIEEVWWWNCIDLAYRMFCDEASNPIKELYWGYEKDGKVVVVADCTTTNGLYEGEEYTPSQLEFFKCLETVNLSEGYATNIFDFNNGDNQDGEWDKDQMTVVFNRLASSNVNKELAVSATMYGSKMAIDCFGNIICMGANHQYVVTPACMNPFVWQAVDVNGVDVGGSGNFINIINAINISQADNGGFAFLRDCQVIYNKNLENISDQTRLHYTGYVHNYGEMGSYVPIGNMLMELPVDSAKFHNDYDDIMVIPARLLRGNSSYLITQNDFWSNNDVAEKSIKAVVSSFGDLNPRDFTANMISDEGVEGDGWWWDDKFISLVYDPVQVVLWMKGKSLSINIMDGFVFIDNLGAYKNPDGSDHDFSAFNVEHYLDSNGQAAGTIAGGVVVDNPFGNRMNDIMSGTLNDLGGATEQALCSIYLSYLYAFFYNEENKADTIGKMGYRIAVENLPTVGMEYLDIDLSYVTEELQAESIQDWTYYLLHPTEGFEYVTTLITNKLNHLLLGWHSDMVGTNGVGVTAGTTKYRGNVGYVTMPDLSEIEWTDKLISFYQDCIPFLIVIIFVLMLFAFITGMLSLQRAALAAVLFSAFLLVPTTLINGTVQLSNSISQRVYGEKFAYWAMVQQESYATKIDEAANAGGGSGTSTYENYLRTLYSLNQSVYSNQGTESIVLKWQAPKKMSSLVLSSEDAKSLEGLDEVGKSMLYGMLGKTYGGESYVDDEDAVYMYRSYIDISNFSRYIYAGIDSGKVSSDDSYTSVSRALEGKLSLNMSHLGTDYEEYRNAGYTNWGMNESAINPSYDYITVPLSSHIMEEALSTDISAMDSKDDLVLINQDVFNFGIPMFTNSTVNFDVETFAATGGIDKDTTEGYKRYLLLEDYMTQPSSLYYNTYVFQEQDYVGLAAYALYSENPYYYFSWKLYHDGLGYTSSLSNRGEYKNLLLGQEDGGYFYMNEGNGGLKDFMDMKSLFTYIIPYLKQGNDIVREWDETYGIFIYDGVPTEEGHWDDVASNPELLAKYWHNLNVSRLYCIYCPWVDVMYDCSYAESETITVMGKKVTIDDPLNPDCYPDNRPMIFSEAEMKDYGLTEADLTKVEKLILKCNEDYQERMYELLNYYNFSDITLNTSAAMQCAFSFNTIFSETGIMEENHNLYPQSYDLANFSYDAFLRFILSESTGESLLDTSVSYGTITGASSGDFYERIVNNSSTTTAIVLLILDVLSIYVLPGLKIFFLVAIFLSSILIVFVCLCKIEDNAKFIRKVISGFLLPLIKFFAITVAFSLIVSLFMGKGNNSVTQTDDLSISLGDPVIVILVMIVLDILVLILYWKIIKGVLQDIKFNGKMALNFTGGVLGAVGGFAVGAVTGAVGAVRNGINNATETHRYRSTKRAIKKYGSDGDPAQTGTGVESNRAARRGSRNIDDRREDSTKYGKDAKKKKAKKNNPSGSDSKSKQKKIDDAAKSGAEKVKKVRKPKKAKEPKKYTKKKKVSK